MRYKIYKIIIPYLLGILFLAFYANATAISMPYLKDKTMVLYPGTSSEFELILQNMIGKEDEKVMLTLEEGNEIAKIGDKENVYNVPKGTKDTKVHIKIEIPSGTPLGTEWTVRFKTAIITEEEEGMIQISGGISDYFKVRVGPVPEQVLTKEKSPINTGWMIGGLIFLIILGVLFVSRMRKQSKKK